MLRSLFIILSQQSTLRRWIENSSVARPLTGRFIAGNTLEDALLVCAKRNKEGYLTTLDYLGESVTEVAAANASRDHYLAALGQIHDRSLQSSISVKLTQLGLDIDPHFCLNNARQIVSLAASLRLHVEFDMESSAYVDRTLSIVETLHSEFGCVRVALQAYLFRTEADLRRLNQLRMPIRLCKGAYAEPSAVAFPEKADVDKNYLQLAHLLLTDGQQPAFATHDERMIVPALSHPAGQIEFQLLYGVRRDLQQRLLAEGHRVRLYIPYGEAWYPYFMRRLAERPANVLFLARNFFR
jgi:proline dehydrogenase